VTNGGIPLLRVEHFLMVIPVLLQVSYSRRVDYISAACVMFERSKYIGLKGFDPVYGLGYYEDTDLAMAFAAAGQDVIYQPLSIVSMLVRDFWLPATPVCEKTGAVPGHCRRCFTKRALLWVRTVLLLNWP
jgi:hypothetical protein